MKKKDAPTKYPIDPQATRPAVLREVASLPWGQAISVRAAKAHLSGLLELVARTGREFVITSDGKPKAKVVPMTAQPTRKPWPGAAEHLKTIPLRPGPTAEELIRTDRDGRGW
ncbi:MAG: type II toxin-antitoxin system prevent-host-death family antitoxin [Verrucomicrobia bacterium]|nr:type II toxin-antitoxin system prevent-host-death family antitoxin [Verrucomicrobiota bacterium]